MNLSYALERCLQDLEAGATIEECVARYPELEAELRPLLQTAAALREAPRVAPSLRFKQATRERILHQAPPATSFIGRDGRVHQPVVVPWWQRLGQMLGQLRLGPAIAGAVASIILLVVLGGTVVSAAGSSMPDSPLYPVKRLTERLQLVFTEDRIDQTTLHLQFAERRIEEAVTVPAEAPALVDDYQRELNAALNILIQLQREGVNPADLESLVGPALRNQRETLDESGRTRLPEPSYQKAVIALYAVQAWLDELRPETVTVSQPPPGPTSLPPSPTDSAPAAVPPTATSELTETPEPPTPTEPLAGGLGESPTATTTPPPTEAPGITPSPTEIPGPAATSTTAPAATATTPAPIPPTSTPVPPSPTPVPLSPTSTPAPPTPTNTPEPYPPVSPTPVPVTPTDTPEPYPPALPTPTPLPRSPTSTAVNRAPVIRSFTCDPYQIALGGRALLTWDAYDPDGDDFIMALNGFPGVGTIIAGPEPSRSAYYIANFELDPGQTATITISLTVKDSRGADTQSSIQIQVVSPSGEN